MRRALASLSSALVLASLPALPFVPAVTACAPAATDAGGAFASGGSDGEVLDAASDASGGDDKADRPDLPLTLVDFAIPAKASKSEARRLLTTRAAFKSFFGVEAPASLDFARRAVVFYAAGEQTLSDVAVSVTRVRQADTGSGLKITTRKTTPAAGCARTIAAYRPAVLVSFAKPAGMSTSVRYYQDDAASACGAASAAEPRLGTATELLDTSCRVVLTSLAREQGPSGGGSSCTNGTCWMAWTGTLDVADGEPGEPVVVFRSTFQPGWWTARATPAAGAPAGFKRYTVRLTDKTVGAGVSATALARTRLEVFAALERTGSRLFDQNRTAGADVLESANGFSLRGAGGCRANSATLRFRGDWRDEQRGALVRRGKLRVEYDLSRLGACRGTHNGFPAWDVRAFVRFLPGGQTFDGSVRALRSTMGGVPTNEAEPAPFMVTVPPGATEAHLWFQNFSGAGSTCVAWDSKNGENYRFPVWAEPPAAVAWAGDLGGSFSRSCVHQDGLADPIAIDSYIIERACSWIDADVYAPGITDGAQYRPQLVLAQVERAYDAGPTTVEWMEPVERVNNNYRFRWRLPREEMQRIAWSTLRYTLRFSSDGVSWSRVGTASGAPRTITKSF